jgi:predicted AlkP superfamily pyrophosphatase or phosphodiesterase
MKGKPLIILDVVGLTKGLVGAKTPNLQDLAQSGTIVPLECPFPALTLSSQAAFLTGGKPCEHGIVGNGWYSRELEEPQFWKQPHRLLQMEDVPTRLRRERRGFRVAKLFWWFNMYAPVDYAITPRPMYPADGRKVPDIHTYPSDLRDQLQRELGNFPLFKFWGPAADITATDWIAKASISLIARERPDLSLVYLPHLDYDFQRFGPTHPKSLRALGAIDAIVGEFKDLAQTLDAELMVLSVYGITPVQRPVSLNRVLREDGYLSVRNELGRERLDCGASRAFAIADHQIAHIIVRDPRDRPKVAERISRVPGVEKVLVGDERNTYGMNHPRSGDILAISKADAWFTYYYWLDDLRAPDYARTVDIHRKPGFDPAELLLDPSLKFPKLKIAHRLLGKKLGFRNLMDVIGLDATLVKGSHGRLPNDLDDGPVLITQTPLPERPLSGAFPYRELPSLIADRSPNI